MVHKPLVLIEHARNVGKKQQAFGLERAGDRARRGVGVDVVGLPSRPEPIGATTGMNSLAAELSRMSRIDLFGSPTKPRSTTSSTSFRDRVRRGELLRDHQVPSLPDRPQAWPPAALIALTICLLIDAGQHHFDHLDGGCIGDAQAAGNSLLMSSRSSMRADLRPAAMHDHRLDARLLQHDDIAGEGLGELRIDHGVAAIFDDDRLLVVALHEGQSLGQNLRGNAGQLSKASIKLGRFGGVGQCFPPKSQLLTAPELRCEWGRLQGAI